MAVALDPKRYHPDTIFARGSGRRLDLPNPDAPTGWNWGACVFGGIWLVAHGYRWLGVVLMLLDAIPVVGIFGHLWCGLNGHRLAYNGRSYVSIEQFRRGQRTWHNAGMVVIAAAALAAFHVMFGVDVRPRDPKLAAAITRTANHDVGQGVHTVNAFLAQTGRRWTPIKRTIEASSTHALGASRTVVAHENMLLAQQARLLERRVTTIFAAGFRPPTKMPARIARQRPTKTTVQIARQRPTKTTVQIAQQRSTTIDRKPRPVALSQRATTIALPVIDRTVAIHVAAETHATAGARSSNALTSLPVCARAWQPIDAAIGAMNDADRLRNSKIAITIAERCAIPNIRNETEALALSQKAIAEHDARLPDWTTDIAKSVRLGNACASNKADDSNPNADQCLRIANRAATMAADWTTRT